MATPKRKRVALDYEKKTEIIKFAEANPKATQQEISNHFTALWDISIKRRTVGDILTDKSRILSDDIEGTPPRKRHRSAHHVDMESALFMWFTNARAQNIPVSDDILKTKAKRFGDEMGITEFQYSNGWLGRFKIRHNITSQVISGESAGIDAALINDGRKKAADAIKNFELHNVFNIDETGLFYRLLPDRSLTTSDSTKGIKKIKDRITVALCCNADGSEKIKPMVIGKSKNPRCFKNFNVNLYVNYTSNKKAWMTSALFHDWLVNFNKSMKRQRRNVLLIMDNAPSHIIPKLSNVKIHFLPPTTTSHLQPLDSGIIQSFKKHYRKQQLTHLVDCIDRKEPPVLLLNTSIRFVRNAWDLVTTQTIVNCWRHSGLISRDGQESECQSLQNPDVELGDLLHSVQDELDLDPDMRLTVRQFVDMDRHLQPTEVISDDDIVQSVTKNDESDSDDEPSEIKLAPPPTYTEAKQAIETVIKFLEHQQVTTETDIRKCIAIQIQINSIAQCLSKQKKIYDFFTNS